MCTQGTTAEQVAGCSSGAANEAACRLPALYDVLAALLRSKCMEQVAEVCGALLRLPLPTGFMHCIARWPLSLAAHHEAEMVRPLNFYSSSGSLGRVSVRLATAADGHRPGDVQVAAAMPPECAPTHDKRCLQAAVGTTPATAESVLQLAMQSQRSVQDDLLRHTVHASMLLRPRGVGEVRPLPCVAACNTG